MVLRLARSVRVCCKGDSGWEFPSHKGFNIKGGSLKIFGSLRVLPDFKLNLQIQTHAKKSDDAECEWANEAVFLK